MSYTISPLNNQHIKKEFDCGQPMLNNYIHRQAKQDIKRKLSVCFVITDAQQNVKGYYTLSNSAIAQEMLPDDIKQKLPPSYAHLPVTLLGRLAIDNSVKGQGLGETLLMDALKRSYLVSKNEIGSMAIVVDPINEDAIRFYKKYGFIILPESGKMFLAMKTLSALFE